MGKVHHIHGIVHNVRGWPNRRGIVSLVRYRKPHENKDVGEFDGCTEIQLSTIDFKPFTLRFDFVADEGIQHDIHIPTEIFERMMTLYRSHKKKVM